MLAPIQDHMAYVVVVAHPNGPYIPERDVADMDRKSIVEDIACGELEDVLQVIELNPVEGTSRAVTDDILSEAAFHILESTHYDDLNDWQRDFVAQHEPMSLHAHQINCCEEDAHRRSLMAGRAA